MEIANHNPVQDAYQFGAIQDSLVSSGVYVLQYEMQPSLPGQTPLVCCTKLNVLADQPVSLQLQVFDHSHHCNGL